MPVKEWFRKLQPMQLYIVLTLTIVFFVAELVMSHITHSLTLLMDSYHVLCNIFALAGCIITIKHGHKADENQKEDCDETSTPSEQQTSKSSTPTPTEEPSADPMLRCRDNKTVKPSHTREQQEKTLKNTFGWARIDVLSMLFCCVFLASLCFSVLMEAFQTLIHIDHLDEMHHPIPVLCVGAAGILLNGFCFLLIGGFTFHQGSFLYVTKSGDVVLDKVVIGNSISRGERRLSRSRLNVNSQRRQRQGAWEMTRDITGCVYVVVCAIIVYVTEREIAKYVDPILSILSAHSLIFFSYPYMKESCMILLQTIPDYVDIEFLKKQLLQQFPEIVNIHDFHVWELTGNKVISTVHMIFQNPKVYANIMKDVKEFFNDSGITQVTIQPEFFTNSGSLEHLPSCLMQCQDEDCKTSHCCPNLANKARKEAIVKPASKEKLPGDEELNLKSIKMLENDLRSSTQSIERCESQNSFEVVMPAEEENKIEEIKTDEVNSDAISVESK